MTVICNNCGGSFDEKETKCPYCGMIYEVGAEKAYHEKLETIRQELDQVDDIVVTDLKSELKQFFLVFAVTIVIVFGIGLLINHNRVVSNEEEQKEKTSKMMDELDEFLKGRERYSEWEALYEKGEYEAMYRLVSKETTLINPPVNWKYYQFYNTYRYGADLTEMLTQAKKRDTIGSYELSQSLYNLFNMYGMVYCDDSYANLKLSHKQKEILGEIYSGLKAEALSVFQMTEEDYEKLCQKAVGDRYTYVSHTICEEIAKERLGQ